MNTTDIVKQIEQIEKQLKYLKSQLKNDQPQELTPVSRAVKIITGGKSSTEEVKSSLQILVDSPQPLSFKQCAFCIFFAFMNHNELGEDIDYFFDL